jgi:Tol biopolymer transport system component
VFDTWKELEGGLPTAPASNRWATREERNLFHTKAEPFEVTAGPIHFFTHVLSPNGKVIFALSTQRRGELVRYDAKARRFSTYFSGISADGISFSHDGAWVAYVKYPQGELWRSRTDGSDHLQLSFHPPMAFGPRWSLYGKQIAFTAQSAGTKFQPYIVSADGSTAPKAEPAAGADPTWSPDGRSLLFENMESPDKPFVQICNLQSGAVSRVPGSEGIGSPRWSPDGKRISGIKYRATEGDCLMLFALKRQEWNEQVQMSANSQNLVARWKIRLLLKWRRGTERISYHSRRQ